MTDHELRTSIETMLVTPTYFRDILASLEHESYRAILRAWSTIRETHDLDRDEQGRYVLEKAGK